MRDQLLVEQRCVQAIAEIQRAGEGTPARRARVWIPRSDIDSIICTSPVVLVVRTWASFLISKSKRI